MARQTQDPHAGLVGDTWDEEQIRQMKHERSVATLAHKMADAGDTNSLLTLREWIKKQDGNVDYEISIIDVELYRRESVIEC